MCVFATSLCMNVGQLSWRLLSQFTMCKYESECVYVFLLIVFMSILITSFSCAFVVVSISFARSFVQQCSSFVLFLSFVNCLMYVNPCRATAAHSHFLWVGTVAACTPNYFPCSKSANVYMLMHSRVFYVACHIKHNFFSAHTALQFGCSLPFSVVVTLPRAIFEQMSPRPRWR